MGRLTGWTLIFDLDGTLVETAEDLAGAMNHVLRAEGLPELPTHAVRPLIGSGAKALIARGFAAAGQELTDAEAERLKLAFLEHYAANIARHSHFFHGALDALDDLSSIGATLSICTNKPQRLTDLLLDALGERTRFAAIIGADSVPNRKPDPGHVLTTLLQAGGEPERALFLGDSETDERAARNAGLPFILYPHGYRSANLETLAPDAVFTSYSDLPELVLQLVGRG